MDTSDQPQEERPYIVHMTPTAYSRLVEFFNRQENSGLCQSDIIENLLKTGESRNVVTFNAPSFSGATANEEQRHGLITMGPMSVGESSRFMEIGDQDELDGNGDVDESCVLDDPGEKADGDNDGGDKQEDTPILPGQRRSRRNHAARHMHDYCPFLTSQPRRPPKAEAKKSKADRKLAVKIRKPCYPDRKGVGTGRQRSWTSTACRYLYTIITKWQRDGLLHCRACNRWLSVVHARSGLRCANALDHVCRHMEKQFYACQLCSVKTVTSMQIRKHMRLVHKRVNDFDDLTDSLPLRNELMAKIAKYFDYTGLEYGPPSGEQRLLTYKRKRGEVGVGPSFRNQEMDMESASVHRVISDLITKWRRKYATYCRLCDHWIRTGTAALWSQTQQALRHLLRHYGKALYICLICKERTVTSTQMMSHVRNVHQTISRGNCVEELDKDKKELKELALKCFDWPDQTGPPKIKDAPFLKKQKKIEKEKKEKKRKQEPFRLEILEYGRMLIKEFCGDGRKLQCALCDTQSVVKKPNGEVRPDCLLDHVLGHIGVNPFACPICEKTSKRKETLRTHVANHKEVKANPQIGLVDRTIEFKQEIMETMKRCYDQNSNQDEDGEDDEDEGTSSNEEME